MRRELRARLTYLAEALEVGDLDTARAIVFDLLDELGGVVTPSGRCRFCGLVDWPGAIERHERITHADAVLDLEERAA